MSSCLLWFLVCLDGMAEPGTRPRTFLLSEMARALGALGPTFAILGDLMLLPDVRL